MVVRLAIAALLLAGCARTGGSPSGAVQSPISPFEIPLGSAGDAAATMSPAPDAVSVDVPAVPCGRGVAGTGTIGQATVSLPVGMPDRAVYVQERLLGWPAVVLAPAGWSCWIPEDEVGPPWLTLFVGPDTETPRLTMTFGQEASVACAVVPGEATAECAAVPSRELAPGVWASDAVPEHAFAAAALFAEASDPGSRLWVSLTCELSPQECEAAAGLAFDPLGTGVGIAVERQLAECSWVDGSGEHDGVLPAVAEPAMGPLLPLGLSLYGDGPNLVAAPSVAFDRAAYPGGPSACSIERGNTGGGTLVSIDTSLWDPGPRIEVALEAGSMNSSLGYAICPWMDPAAIGYDPCDGTETPPPDAITETAEGGTVIRWARQGLPDGAIERGFVRWAPNDQSVGIGASCSVTGSDGVGLRHALMVRFCELTLRETERIAELWQ